MRQPTEALTLVSVTTEVPYDNIVHAGGRYLSILYRSMRRSGVEPTVLAPWSPSNARAARAMGAPPDLTLLPDLDPTPSPVERFFDDLLHRLDPGLPPVRLVRGLITDADRRQAIGRAAVIDLQWDAAGRLAPLLRRVNSRARIVTSLHDVQSQRFGRMAQRRSGLKRLKWRIHTLTARLWEAAILRASDVVIVFSDKDQGLLPRSDKVLVVHPPLATGSLTGSTRSEVVNGLVLFVGLLGRGDNHDAVMWFLEESWPRVLQECPTARLRIVGAGASHELTAVVSRSTNVHLAGFVDDLPAEYRRASVCVVPLRSGAGVKYKTIEAVLAEAPIVTTTIGAEGVGGPELFTALADDPHGFAAGVVTALQEPAAAQQRATATAHRLRARYEPEAFERAVDAAYTLRLIAPRQDPTSNRPSST